MINLKFLLYTYIFFYLSDIIDVNVISIFEKQNLFLKYNINKMQTFFLFLIAITNFAKLIICQVQKKFSKQIGGQNFQNYSLDFNQLFFV